MRRLMGLGLALLLAACAGLPARQAPPALPRLHLAPAALGRPLAAQQHLLFSFGRQQRALQALLEVDADEVRLAVEALGQSGVRLRWDGRQLQERRAAWLPPQVRAERVLDDLQFALWPEAAIVAALPSGWQLLADARQRRLLHQGQVWLQVDYAAAAMHLDNQAEGYRLQIHSRELEAGP